MSRIYGCLTVCHRLVDCRMENHHRSASTETIPRCRKSCTQIHTSHEYEHLAIGFVLQSFFRAFDTVYGAECMCVWKVEANVNRTHKTSTDYKWRECITMSELYALRYRCHFWCLRVGHESQAQHLHWQLLS